MDNTVYQHKYKPYGELEYCCKCMGMEGSMTTDCPGRPLTEKETEAIYDGYLDFVKEVGWSNTLSPMGVTRVQSHFYRVTRKLGGHEFIEMDDLYVEFPVSVHAEIIKLVKQLTDLEFDLDKME